jgi:hypothetical protein
MPSAESEPVDGSKDLVDERELSPSAPGRRRSVMLYCRHDEIRLLAKPLCLVSRVSPGEVVRVRRS